MARSSSTVGAEKFIRWMGEAPGERTQSAVGELLGVEQSTIWGWMHGRRPRAHHRIVIEALTGIPAEDWMTGAEQRELRVALDRVAKGAA